MPEQPSTSTRPAPGFPFVGVTQRSLTRARDLNREEPVRSSVPLGTIDAGAIADVDPAGLVQMRGASWSVDWWIGAADRWHFPSGDPTVVQSVVDSTPVVQTAMHVPGGDIRHRAFAVRSTTDGEPRWDDSAVVIEVENRTKTPVALAFAFVPLQLFGPGEIRTLAVDDATISVDGEIAGLLSRPVARRVVGPPGTTSIRLPMTDDEDPEGTWFVPDQMAEGAYVVPLPHSATVRLMLPRIDSTDGAGAGILGRRKQVVRARPSGAWQAPTSDQVAAGWAVHTRDMASMATPEAVLAKLLKVSEAHLMVAATDAFLDGDGVTSTALRNAQLTEALVTAGVDEPLGPISRALVDSQRMNGSLQMPDRSDATVALVHAAAPLLVGSRSESWAEELIGPVAKAIHRLDRGKGLGGATRESGFAAALGEWALTRSAAIATARIAPALRSIGQPEVAEAAEVVTGQLWDRTAIALQRLGGESSVPPPAERDSLMIKALALRASLDDGADSGVEHLLTFAELGSLGVIGDSADAAGVPGGRLAADPATTATRVSALLDLVCSQGQEGPVILPCWSPYWFEKPVEVTRVRTAWGLVSYALRWHGQRPTILWEVEAADGSEPDREPVLTAPGLDPAWRASGWSGEALLAPVAVGQDVLDEIARRDTPQLAVQLGSKKRS